MWQDMGLYWAWRGITPINGVPPPPTHKRIEYAEIVGPGRYLNGPEKGKLSRMKLAITVFDDDLPRDINREELEWHRRHGAEILMPNRWTLFVPGWIRFRLIFGGTIEWLNKKARSLNLSMRK